MFIGDAGMAKRLHFLPWDQPLLPQAVAWLAADWSGMGPLDVSDRLVIVATRQAGRRLMRVISQRHVAPDQAVC